MRIASIVSVTVVLLSTTASAAPTPLRVVPVTSSDQLNAALTSAKPGDWIELASGTYTGTFTAALAGTETNPIVITIQPQAHAIIDGGLIAKAGVSDIWFWGLEVTGTTSADVDSGIQIQGPRTKIINNYIHDVMMVPTNGQNARNGIAAWQQNGGGAGQEIYGNVVVRAHHNIYTQSDYDHDGYKKFIQNILDEDVGRMDGSNKFVMHCYTEGGVASGCDWEQAIAVDGGRFLMGSTNDTTRHSVIKDSVFYKSTPQIQYATPAQTDGFSGNRLYRTNVSIGYQLGPLNIHDNAFYAGISNLRPSDASMVTRTFTASDVLDWNVYQADTPTSSIHSSWWLVNSHQDCCGTGSLDSLRKDTAATGCTTCELHGSTVVAPPAVDVTIYANAYEAGRGEMAVYHHLATGPNVVAIPAATFAKVVQSGAGYAIVRAVDGPWSQPVAIGVFTGADVSLTVTDEFEAFLVLPRDIESADGGAMTSPDASTPPNPNDPTPQDAAGCSCHATASRHGGFGVIAVALAFLFARRRARA